MLHHIKPMLYNTPQFGLTQLDYDVELKIWECNPIGTKIYFICDSRTLAHILRGGKACVY